MPLHINVLFYRSDAVKFMGLMMPSLFKCGAHKNKLLSVIPYKFRKSIMNVAKPHNTSVREGWRHYFPKEIFKRSMRLAAASCFFQDVLARLSAEDSPWV